MLNVVPYKENYAAFFFYFFFLLGTGKIVLFAFHIIWDEDSFKSVCPFFDTFATPANKPQD